MKGRVPSPRLKPLSPNSLIHEVRPGYHRKPVLRRSMASGFYSTTGTSLWPRDPYPPARQVWVYVGVCVCARERAFGGEGGTY